MERGRTEAIPLIDDGDVGVEEWPVDLWLGFTLDRLRATARGQIAAEVLEVEGGGETSVGTAGYENPEGCCRCCEGAHYE